LSSGYERVAMQKLFNKKLNPALCVVFFLLFFAGTWKDIFRSVPEQAEQAYKAGKYEKALQLYQEAQTRNPDSDTLAYNLGNTLYKLGRYQEAAAVFAKILEKNNPALAANSVYNMGNTLFEMGKQTQDQQMFRQALEAFKQSIMLDSKDEDAKYNYELVKRLLKEQQKMQQPSQDQKKDKQEQKQQRGNQQNKEKEKKQQQQQKQSKEQQRKQQPQQAQPPQAPETKGRMSKEEARRLLDALLLMEKQAKQKEKEKKAATQRGRGPDW